MTTDHNRLRHADLPTVRQAIRAGQYTAHTAGLGAGYLQANLAVLPSAYALDFMRFCQRNPKPCPLVGVSDTGNPMMTTMGRDIDIRTDVPAYNIYRDGQLARSVTDITDLWTDDMVAFALGCSFTFENALMQAGIPVWHIDNDTTVPMFRSSIDTVPAGPFWGKMVVSMRAVPNPRVDEVREISRRFPLAHGAPVHVGDPAAIGITDPGAPDWGDPAPIPADHVPVFWACGVTPQVALEAASPPLCITHKPGHMLITDIPEDAETPVLPQHTTQTRQPRRA
ncbi:putative hydro-lyase [Lutimaribacter sp. EGI FJ00015]|uniref:Hydro-lyase n=1 Tax=Lutimaribacter degradans TaxID=2945989 RepID=A0ACC5ZYF7_9RHOB|nr:putative hydro-lyase [Lutimaribacter sp. EGI FJ00013]MCM2562953.1 putative hydro-lyase [Lutimaribacter sp. EGI FJ00013]MCO0614121.1 putative hydro-lyase [Lutimaribacter sp. EGI FJ00015]MCO0636098.1 putative hydro-lyase [Lutimaribacter sp. EGI FJ00014]